MSDSESEKLTPDLVLKWNPDRDDYEPVDSNAGDGIFLSMYNTKKAWVYDFVNAPLISRRKAERKADSIARTGYLNPKDGIRYGAGYKLILAKSRETGLSKDLIKSQRDWYIKK